MIHRKFMWGIHAYENTLLFVDDTKSDLLSRFFGRDDEYTIAGYNMIPFPKNWGLNPRRAFKEYQQLNKHQNARIVKLYVEWET